MVARPLFAMAKKDPPPFGYDKKGWPIWAVNEQGEPVCGKRSQRQKRPCQSKIRTPNGRCMIPGHGGSAKDGRPITKGTQSKYIPRNLEKAVAELEADPELTGLRQEVALAKARKRAVLVEIRALEEAGHDTKEKWAEHDLLEDRVERLAMSENKRQAQLASSITARQALALQASILTHLLDVCNDLSVPREKITTFVAIRLDRQRRKQSV